MYNEPWIEIVDGKEVSRKPTWREKLHRFYIRDFAKTVITVVSIAIVAFVINVIVNAEAEAAAAFARAKSAAIAQLREEDIPLFTGDYSFELTVFSDYRSSTPTYQEFQILGNEQTNNGEVYYLIDEDGYVSTLTFQHNGMPLWQPGYGDYEPVVNPYSEDPSRRLLEGDFAVRFVFEESSEPTTPVKPAGAAPYDGPVVP